MARNPMDMDPEGPANIPPIPSSDPNLGHGGILDQSLNNKLSKSYLWSGRITHVDYETMVCSIRFDTGLGEWHDIPLPAPAGSSNRSWSGIVPEPGTKVIIGWTKYSNRGFKPQIVQFLTTGVFPAREFEVFSSADPTMAKTALDILPELEDDPGLFLRPVRLKLRKVYPGDYLATSSSGADFILDKDVYFTNRSGNEFRLRDTDQTAILQTVNTFESNSAGYYRRGLIRRNAFELLPDLGFDSETDTFDKTKNPDAFNKLVNFGIIKSDGTPNFPEDADNIYPFDVMPDGMRMSYIHHGETDVQFSGNEAPEDCYVEDRIELRHTHTGVMEVTEEGDGFQLERFDPYIEDVSGTVVGNDPFSEDGRTLYKRILSMRLFNNFDAEWNPGIKPRFYAVDQLVRGSEDADTLALARLFKIKCPRNNNQFVFGITKEGRAFLHVPSSTGNIPDEKGKSIDIFTAGKIRAAIGKDPSDSRSLDVAFSGGIRLDIGRSTSGHSIEVKYSGPIRQIFAGNDDNGIASQTTIGGSSYEATSGDKFVSVSGGSSEVIGGDKTIESERLTVNSGTGGFALKAAGNVSETILGKKDYKIALLQNEVYALGRVALTLAGGISDTLLAGAYARTVTAGTIVDTVAAGNYSQSVGAGNMSVAVGAGNLSLVTAAGAATLASTTSTIVASTGVTQILGPVVKIGTVPGPFGIGNAVAGVPGPPVVFTCYITGLPARGISTIFLGP